jgi:hypothetical protein
MFHRLKDATSVQYAWTKLMQDEQPRCINIKCFDFNVKPHLSPDALKYLFQAALDEACSPRSAHSCSAKNRSASSAAMQPMPAEVTAWR